MKKHINTLLLLYGPFYMICFTFLEKQTPATIHYIHCPLDDMIPFVECFVIPYLLWFVYIGGFGIYFFFREKETFQKMMLFGILGMNTFLLVSLFYPNGLQLRPDVLTNDTVFTKLLQLVYAKDTATNVLPSIHVYNSIVIWSAVRYSSSLKDKKWLQSASTILAVSIILSTMFIKQHSVIDVIAGLTLAFLFQRILYPNTQTQKSPALSR